MADEKIQETMIDQSVIYQFRIKGHLGPEWSDWFGGMSIVMESGGDSLVTGASVDQAQLHGVLRKIRDLGLPLISVQRVSCDEAIPTSSGSTVDGKER